MQGLFDNIVSSIFTTMVISFTSVVQRYGEQGEKTGWFYLAIPAVEAQRLHSADRKGFRVKGYLNEVAIAQQALIPMGEGDYILPLNATLRKALRQPALGIVVQLRLQKDVSELTIDPDFEVCLAEEPAALTFFRSLAPSHQKYFSKWIAEAKTEVTKTKRIALAIEGLSRKMDYGSMIRMGRERKL